MKMPLTDKFLLDVYSFMEQASDGFEVFFPRIKTMRETMCPEYYQLKREYEKKEDRKRFSQFVYSLKKRGYIRIKNLEGKKGVMLTPKGMEKVLKVKLKTEEKKKRKDGRWLMVIFDVPEKKRELRDLFRDHLKGLGFKMFQRSIWVCPFDVFEKVEDITRRYSLDFYVRLFLIEEITV